MPKKISCAGKFFIRGLIAAGLITRKVDFTNVDDMDRAYRDMCDEHISHREGMAKKIMWLDAQLRGAEREAGMLLLPCGVDGDENMYMVPPHVVILQGIPSPEALQKFPNSKEFLKEMYANHKDSIPPEFRELSSLPPEIKSILEKVVGFGDIGKEKFEENTDKKMLPIEKVFEEKNLKNLKKSATISKEESVKQAEKRIEKLRVFLHQTFEEIRK